jgi:hypothetical protein
MDARLDVSAPRLADEQALNLVLLNLLQLIYKTMEYLDPSLSHS